MTKSIKRSFYYYDLNLMKHQKDNFNKATLLRVKHQKEEYYAIFEYLKKLQESEEKDDGAKLIADMEGGDKLYIIVDELAMPFIETNGQLSLITDYLNTDFTLAEVTHCVIFPESGIMGAEFNFNGARATAIRWYLPRVYNKIDYVSCKDRLNGDAIKKLAEGETFSLFKLVVQNSEEMLAELAKKKSVFCIAAGGVPAEVDTYEITLKRRKTKRKRGFDSPIPIDEMEEFIKDNRDFIKSFEVSQGSIMKDCINLLEDKLVTTKEFVRSIKKTIDSQKAYEIIVDYYEGTVKPN